MIRTLQLSFVTVVCQDTVFVCHSIMGFHFSLFCFSLLEPVTIWKYQSILTQCLFVTYHFLQ